MFEEEEKTERENFYVLSTLILKSETMKRWKDEEIYILLINFTSSWKTWKKEKLLIDYENSLLFDML